MSIALKEANETEYWLFILKDTNYIEMKIYDSIIKDSRELVALLAATVKTSKENGKKSDTVRSEK